VPQGTLCQCEIEVKKTRHREYSKTVRYNVTNKKYTDFYNSGAWRKESNHIRAKYIEACLMCLIKYNILVPSDMAHHIVPIRDDYDKRLEDDNLIPLCHCCHNNIDHDNYSEDIKEELRELIKDYYKIYI
jgi:5-methylcytosine-specific restriction protein A